MAGDWSRGLKVTILKTVLCPPLPSSSSSSTLLPLLPITWSAARAYPRSKITNTHSDVWILTYRSRL